MLCSSPIYYQSILTQCSLESLTIPGSNFLFPVRKPASVLQQHISNFTWLSHYHPKLNVSEKELVSEIRVGVCEALSPVLGSIHPLSASSVAKVTRK